MIGWARTINPIAAGIVSNVTSRSACASAERNAGMSPSAAVRETNGKVTVPTATPKMPSGNCIRRNAMFNQLTGPSPRRAAGGDYGRTHQRQHSSHALIAPVKVRVVLVTDTTQRRKLRRQLPNAPDQSPDRQSNQRARSGMGAEPPTECDAANDRSEIEKTRRHRRRAEDMLRVKHS